MTRTRDRETVKPPAGVPIRGRTCLAIILLGLLALGFGVGSSAAENRIDRVRPDAPELAAFGDYDVGVHTLDLVHRDQLDVVATEAAGDDIETPKRYDRPLVVDVWYPSGSGGSSTPYEVTLRDGRTSVEVHGRARRAAAPDRSGAPYPLVLISHGYPGNRFLLSHLAENLASKGYVVASIDHTDSTYRTLAAFSSTLVNRPLDQLFVLDELERLAAAEEGLLAGLVDTRRTGLVGYSMGGYGAIITAGGGITAESASRGAGLGMLGMHRAGSDELERRFVEQIEPRIKAVVAFAPWGMTNEVWDAEGLAAIRIPTLFVAGSADAISGYDDGVRAMFEQAVAVDRHLLTFENAGHNAAAPMPAPEETYDARAIYSHYADPVWDSTRMNNIAQHFVAAYFGLLLQHDESMASYLNLVEESDKGVWAKNPDGSSKPEHTYWHGFANNTARGLRFEKLVAER